MLSFNILSLKSSMIFHRCYHYTVALQLNHLLFLNTYMFGILSIAASILQGWYLAYAVTLIYAAYALYLARFWAVPYLCLVSLLAVLATELATTMLQNEESNQTSYIAPLTGLGIVLGSFIAQLAGHAMFETFAAPPHLFHGFIAAPLLEFVSLLFSMGFMPVLSEQVDVEVERHRVGSHPAPLLTHNNEAS